MIRINLLPFRLARKKENIRRQVSIFLLSIVLICLVLVWYTLGMDKKIAHTRSEITGVKAQIALYKEKADRVTALKAKLKRLKEKLAIVASLQTRKNEQQILLEELADRIVKERMWLESLNADAQRVTLKGVAFDNPTIADFMRNLEASPLFSGVDLKRSVNRTFENDIDLKTFELVCTKAKPKTPEPQKKGQIDMADEEQKERISQKLKTSVDQLFARIGKLTKVQRILICVVSVCLLGGGYYYFIYGPKAEVMRAAQAELETQKQKLNTYKIKARSLKKVERQMAEVQEEFDLAMRALPDKKELPSLLVGVSKAGGSAGLEFLLFQPETVVDKEFYKEIPLSMTVSGTYQQVADFFFRVASLNRIVNINDLSVAIDTKNKGKVSMKCSAVTYMFAEQTGKDEKGRKAKKGKKR